jgi:hypothetical protein
MFPTCQIVHIIRDARDVTTSSLDAFRGARFFYMDPYYAARMWRVRLGAGIAAGRRLPAGRYYEIRYEELTAEPEPQLRKLCDFLGEDFDPAMLAPNMEASKHYHSFGIHTQTNRQVTAARQGRWHKDLAPADARIVQRVAGKLLRALDYPLEDLGKQSAAERIRMLALQVKFVVLDTGRRVLRHLGIFNPARLLLWLPRRRPRIQDAAERAAVAGANTDRR